MFPMMRRRVVQQSEPLDFSGLFKLDLLIHLDISSYSFYEIGLKKFFAFSSDKELVFIYINPQCERFEKNYYWDFLDNPIYCMCFEPSGTWVVLVSEQKVLLVPFLPLFVPQNVFDHKWSLSSVTVLPLINLITPISAVFWLTKEAENILIIGLKNGKIIFYSLESQSIVGECKVFGEISHMQMCFDDSLDLLTLLITTNKSQQWKLVVEHRSIGYSWIKQIRFQNCKDKKESFMSYIIQLSKDKITFFTLGGSKDENQTAVVEHLTKPTEYLPRYHKSANSWALTAQYVNGRHFLTAFDLNEATINLESPEERISLRTLRPIIRKDGLYIQGLWSPKLLYLLKKNELEIHSTNFSAIQGDSLLGLKREHTVLWSIELIGEVRRAHLMTAKDPPSGPGRWQEPKLISDLQLPRISIEPCLVITNSGAYIMNTICEPCEWIVGLIMRGGTGAEQLASGLNISVSELLRASSDMLIARGKIAPARYLYSLSQCDPDGWVARLGTYGQLNHLLGFKPLPNTGTLGHAAITIKILTTLRKMIINTTEKVDLDVKFASLKQTELQELTWFTAAIGLWHLIPIFSVSRGNLTTILTAIKYRKNICRGALNCILAQRCLVLSLLEGNEEWFLEFLTDNCENIDTVILKCFCLWLNPLQDQFRPIMRDMKQGFSSNHITKLRSVISTFMRLASVIESREPCPEMYLEVKLISETWKNHFKSRRALSCGLHHWAIVDNGNGRVMLAKSNVNIQIIGRVIDVACGRHHTLVLTENGIYSAGDNMFGQLGVGAAWGGAVGESTSADGSLMHVQRRWTAPVVAVAAGYYHSAAVDLGGRLYTWGWGVHGQLGLGSIDDQWSPQLVPKFLGRKVVSVSCGACHTCILVGGEVWVCGAGTCGQLGGVTGVGVGANARNKTSVPVRVSLQDHVFAIAAGYFHNLAISDKGQVWIWGASPQQVRARTVAVRRSHDAHTPTEPPSSPVTPTEIQQENHLYPQLVDVSNVRGRIIKVAAGWHHSVIMNNVGTIYSWGLNLDGQLGSGDRKLVKIPTEVKIRTDSQPDTVKNSNDRSPDIDIEESNTKAMVGCGGDFTIYVDDDGRIYATGNALLSVNNGKDKANNRIIMMKTTRRLIKIPANQSINKYQFQPLDRIDIMFPFDIDGIQRNPLEPRLNPLTSINDFKKKTWSDYIIILLKHWINEEDLKDNLNLRAKLAFHEKKYAKCLKLLLENAKCKPKEDCFYVIHTMIDKSHTNVIPNQCKVESVLDTNEILDKNKVESVTDTNEIPDRSKVESVTDTNEILDQNKVESVTVTNEVPDESKVESVTDTNEIPEQNKVESVTFTNEVPEESKVESVMDTNFIPDQDKAKLVTDTNVIPDQNKVDPVTDIIAIADEDRGYIVREIDVIPDQDKIEVLTDTDVITNLEKIKTVADTNFIPDQNKVEIVMDKNVIPDQDKLINFTDKMKLLTSVMLKRIKEISLTILNEEDYTPINPDIYKELYCSCDEMKYFKKPEISQTLPVTEDLSENAINIIDKCISIFPTDTKLWEECFRISKDFYLENNLPISELERILHKYIESNATTMAAAIMYSNDCAQYTDILSPQFFLNMCSQVLDSWG